MKQKNYPFEKHLLPKDKIDKDALYVTRKLQEKGHSAYLVGGSVRDLLLKQTPKDFDVSTSAKPEEIKQIFRNCYLVGKRFRLAHVRFGHNIIEVATFRTGDPQAEELIVRDNQWGNEEEDVLRRDFTINGLFYDPSTESLIDYVGGYDDIKKNILRCIGKPFVRFKQDPVRMIRLIKFQARFGFEIENDALIALLECRQEILKSSSARVLEELGRMLESKASSPFFKLLLQHGFLELLFPALSHAIDLGDADEIFNYLNEVDKSSYFFPRAILFACLLYPPFSKRVHRQFSDRKRIAHLGEIQECASEFILEVFHPYFRLPRRLRYELISILSDQYRLTPLQKKKIKRLRIPRNPDFALSLKFLKLRSYLEPGLQEIASNWEEAEKKHVKEHPPVRRPRRRDS